MIIFNISQVSAAAVEFVSSSFAFWKQTGEAYQLENPAESNAKGGRTREAMRNKVTWIFALFIFGYVGAEGKTPFSR